ncbi:hypothetical protein AEM51_07990 [Bacteroidetes bacterium UKL13-3]|nr:hypothetical protein AEM51_07990 [Bacteroidetes bacterium UKL13-3]HCP94221.1 hypothetical protein [Bacteroidota bacterium]
MSNTIEYSPVESKRFGINVYRTVQEKLNIELIIKCITNKDVDLLIMRLPVENITEYHQLSSLNCDVVLADTLVYYYADLTKISLHKLKNENLSFERVTNQNISLIGQLVPIIFSNYTNHYFSNPDLPKDKITEGYVEWASSYVNEDNGKVSWIVLKDNTPIGFATCSFSVEHSECEGVLYGVHPDFAGGGVYSDIIRFTQSYFKELNFKSMKVSTQIQNFAVQKVWTREGFILKKAFYTYHLNRLKK